MAKSRPTRRTVCERRKRSSDRDAKGRFRAGNRAAVGHGRPLSAAVHALRAATFSALTPELWRRIVARQIEAALEGDLAAARALFAWSQGEAIPADLADLIDQLQERSNGTGSTTSTSADSRWQAVAALAAGRPRPDSG